jgi:hypothetical protein
MDTPSWPKRQRSRKLAVLGTTILAAYTLIVRPWSLRWGATDDEAGQALPGDDLVPNATYVTTRALTINAPASAVWPWLVQIGQGRGGLYSYDWLENLIGLDFHSANRVVPELQDLKIGDLIRLGPEPDPVSGGPDLTLAVTTLEPGRALVVRTFDRHTSHPIAPGNYMRGEIAGTWAWTLTDVDAARCRLVARYRAAYQPSLAAVAFQHLLLEPAHFIMERRMLLGIKVRAERAWATKSSSAIG